MNSLPDEMTQTSRTNPRPEPLPRSLLVMLSLLVVLGMASTAASVVAARGDDAANQRVLQELQEQEDQQSQNVSEHRDFNQRDHDCLIALALILADPTRDRTRPVEAPCRAATLPAEGVEVEPITP